MTENRFDEKAATWDDNPRRAALTKAIAEAIKKNVPLNNDMKVLEFGCGTAAISVLLADAVGHIDAADNSKGMIEQVQLKLADSPTLAEKISPANLEYPLEENLKGKWDLICSAMVMHHVEDINSVLKYLAGCVSDGGYIAMADLYTEDGSFHGEYKVPHNGFDPNELADVLKEAAMTDTKIEKVVTFNRPETEDPEKEYSLFLLVGRK